MPFNSCFYSSRMSYSALAAQRTRESITDWEYKTYEYITLQTDDEETQAQRYIYLHLINITVVPYVSY